MRNAVPPNEPSMTHACRLAAGPGGIIFFDMRRESQARGDCEDVRGVSTVRRGPSMRHRDICESRRAASDLLRWSMGGKPRFGKEYSEYQAPANPAKPPVSAKSLARDAGWYSRMLSLHALAGFLRWALAVTEPRRKSDTPAE